MNNAERFVWNEIQEGFIRDYGVEDGVKVCDYAQKVYFRSGNMTLAVVQATEWANRMRMGV